MWTYCPIIVGMSIKQTNQFHTINEVAKMLHLKPQTVYRMVYRGDINGSRFGRAVRISQAEIDRLIKQSAKGK